MTSCTPSRPEIQVAILMDHLACLCEQTELHACMFIVHNRACICLITTCSLAAHVYCIQPRKSTLCSQLAFPHTDTHADRHGHTDTHRDRHAYTHRHTYKHTQTHTQTDMDTQTHTETDMHTHADRHGHTDTHRHTCIHTQTHMHAHRQAHAQTWHRPGDQPPRVSKMLAGQLLYHFQQQLVHEVQVDTGGYKPCVMRYHALLQSVALVHVL